MICYISAWLCQSPDCLCKDYMSHGLVFLPNSSRPVWYVGYYCRTSHWQTKKHESWILLLSSFLIIGEIVLFFWSGPNIQELDLWDGKYYLLYPFQAFRLKRFHAIHGSIFISSPSQWTILIAYTLAIFRCKMFGIKDWSYRLLSVSHRYQVVLFATTMLWSRHCVPTEIQFCNTKNITQVP